MNYEVHISVLAFEIFLQRPQNIHRRFRTTGPRIFTNFLKEQI
jgi:hypothetical protein